MRSKIIIAALILFAAVCGAHAQTGSAKTQTQLNNEVNSLITDNVVGADTPFNMRQTLLDIIASTVPAQPLADPRTFQSGLVCSGSADASVGIAAAIAAGFQRIRLPAGCVYQPPTSSGNEVIPNGVQIVGDNGDPNIGLFSLVRTANRLSGTDFLVLGKGSSLSNVATQSNFCDVQTAPTNTQKVCPLYYANNIGDQAQVVTNWPYESFWFQTGTSTTQPGGVVSLDTPIIGMIQNSLGDGIYCATGAGGICIRIQTVGNIDGGLLIQNGVQNPGNQHFGFHCVELSTTTSSNCINIERSASTGILEKFQDDVGGIATADWQQWVVSFQSGGNIRNTFQTTTAFNGNFDLINAGNGGGTFTGNFALYEIAGTAKYSVNSAGAVASASSIQTGVTTVGSLPTCNSAAKGTRFFVTDANANTFHTTAVGGGANNMGVLCDGTNWYLD